MKTSTSPFVNQRVILWSSLHLLCYICKDFSCNIFCLKQTHIPFNNVLNITSVLNSGIGHKLFIEQIPNASIQLGAIEEQ